MKAEFWPFEDKSKKLESFGGSLLWLVCGKFLI